MVTILGIETSCDDTAAAVVVDGKIVANVIASSQKLHAKTGGIVPEVAARAHVENILPAIDDALKIAKLESIRDVTAIAVTVGPGLLGSLLVGTETAKTLSYIFKKPIIGVNHLEGHILSAVAEQFPISSFQFSKVLPAIALVVSGGHTELVYIKKLFNYKVIGRTRDDAAGEAFDKIGKMLGLPYPGGPAIAALAAKLKVKNEKLKINFPRPMLDSGDFNFSFSGLKTAVFNFLKKNPKVSKAEIAASVQEAIVDVLVKKTNRAALRFGAKTILLGGGVAANQALRERLPEALISPKELTMDNAAMIALAGYLRFMAGKPARHRYTQALAGGRDSWYDVRTNPNLGL